jgi:hypothetical protein
MDEELMKITESILTFGKLFLVQGGVNMINKWVKEGKCSIFLNSLVCLLCVVCFRCLLATLHSCVKGVLSHVSF